MLLLLWNIVGGISVTPTVGKPYLGEQFLSLSLNNKIKKRAKVKIKFLYLTVLPFYC